MAAESSSEDDIPISKRFEFAAKRAQATSGIEDGKAGTTKADASYPSEINGKQGPPGFQRPKKPVAAVNPVAKQSNGQAASIDTKLAEDTEMLHLDPQPSTAPVGVKKEAQNGISAQESASSSDNSEDDIPLFELHEASAPAASSDSDSDPMENVPLSARVFKYKPKKKVRSESQDAKRKKGPTQGKEPKRRKVPAHSEETKQKKASTQSKKTMEDKVLERKEWMARQKAEGKRRDFTEEKKIYWTTLSHNGVLFPPEYEPHGVKMLYDGAPCNLTAEEEEVATMFAVMLETDYMKKQKFLDNFWADFRSILGKGHVIKSLAKCDFRPIYEHLMAEREKKKALSKEEKQRLKEEKEKETDRYKFARVDDRQELVGNFRVEPPGLFRGRGEHPKMGKLKRRIYPRDIIINIGEGEPVPEHPYPGQKWKEVRHDQTVTWLAYWKDPIQTSSSKYVFLGANSVFKSESDQQKYEKARELKKHIDAIRTSYRRDWGSKDLRTRQMAVALYFIDILALRAGHEKDEEEADTVGCCTLKVDNVECINDPEREHHIAFDFLGKDSIKYVNEVKVEPRVFQLVKEFCRGDGRKAKAPADELFETMNAQDLNHRLKELMDGLSVKVFRTFNASSTLDKELYRESTSATMEQKKAEYDLANREVAILCNHQRAVPKGHEDQMTRLSEKLLTAREELEEMELELKVVLGKTNPKKLKNPDKKLGNEESLRNKVEKKKQQLARLQVQSKSKEDLKTVALGTSKINYLDPRITVAWCKRQDMPIEKVFNKSLLSKFHWAMEVEPEFRF